jgi:hypothetical protein
MQHVRKHPLVAARSVVYKPAGFSSEKLGRTTSARFTAAGDLL